MQTLCTLYRDERIRPLVCDELTLAFSRTLSTIVPDTHAFQAMMRRTRSIISGSTALHHLLRSPNTWKPTDVDLIVPNHRYDEAVDFILDIPGAKVIQEFPQMYEVSGFAHITQIQTPLTKFDVIQSTESSPFLPLTFYYGTHVMNAITADLVVSPYPSLTLEGRGLLVRPRSGNAHRTTLAIEKYKQRGFEFSEHVPSSEEVEPSCDHVVTCPTRERAFGDTSCLIIPHTHRPIQETLDLMDEHNSTQWKLGGWECSKHAWVGSAHPLVEDTTWGDASYLNRCSTV